MRSGEKNRVRQRSGVAAPAWRPRACRRPLLFYGAEQTTTRRAVRVHEQDVEIRRSARRRRTVSAYREDGRSIVLVPAGLAPQEEARLVQRMLARLDAQDERRAAPSDAALARRARELSRRHLGGRARPRSVRWSTTQRRRWGSCTPAEGTIRISSRLAAMPGWVLDYVLVHELVHLLHADHGERFWAEVAAYPHAERARGFLEGYVAGARGSSDGDELPTADADADGAEGAPDAVR